MRNKIVPSLIMTILFTIFMTMPVHAKEAVGKTTRIQSEALINGAPAIQGTPVHPGDVIMTGETGRLEVTFNDSTTLTVGGNSEFIIDAYSYGEDTKDGEALFSLSRGAFRAVTSAVVNIAPENFQVTTPLATIGIRGTDFWGGYLSADQLSVIMLKGKGVAITTKGGTVLIDKPGFGISVDTPNLPPQNLKKWGQAKVDKALATINFK